MTEARRDLDDILFAQDARDGMKIVASTFARSTNGAVLRAHWNRQLAPYYRLKYEPEVSRPPEEAFTYVVLDDGSAAVLKRVKGRSTAGRNFSHALVGAPEVLDELALPLTSWKGWYNEEDAEADLLEDRDVDKLRKIVRSHQDTLHTAIEEVPRDKVIGLLARVLAEPTARFTFVGIDPADAPAVLALVRYIVTDLAGMTRRWTFSTFEAHREPRQLPDFVFMPLNVGALEDSGGARTVVDLTVGSVDPGDEAEAATLVDLYLEAWRRGTHHLERTRLLTQLERKIQKLLQPRGSSDGQIDQSLDRGRHHADDDVPGLSDVDGHEAGAFSPEGFPDTEPEMPDPDPVQAAPPLPLADATAEDLELAAYPDTVTAAAPVETALERHQMDLAREEAMRWHEAEVLKAEERRRKAVARELAAHQEEERRAMNRRQSETSSSVVVVPNFVISDQETFIQALAHAETNEQVIDVLIRARGIYVSATARKRVWHELTAGHKLRRILNDAYESRKLLVMETVVDLLVGRLELVDHTFDLDPNTMIQWLEDNVAQHFGNEVRKRVAALSPSPQMVQGGSVVPLFWVIVAVGLTFVFAVMIGILLGALWS